MFRDPSKLLEGSGVLFAAVLLVAGTEALREKALLREVHYDFEVTEMISLQYAERSSNPRPFVAHLGLQACVWATAVNDGMGSFWAPQSSTRHSRRSVCPYSVVCVNS